MGLGLVSLAGHTVAGDFWLPGIIAKTLAHVTVSFRHWDFCWYCEGPSGNLIPCFTLAVIFPRNLKDFFRQPSTTIILEKQSSGESLGVSVASLSHHLRGLP